MQMEMNGNGAKLRMLARACPFLDSCVKRIWCLGKEKEFVVEDLLGDL